MKDAHPSPTAGDGRLIEDEHGEEEYYYCKQCGFPCKKGRDKLGGKGDGIEVSNGDTKVNSGCPFCGSYNWR